jgi:glycosyltransferase involved in cell wall biosynthesis
MLREEGRTGVHTHARQLRAYLAAHGTPATIVTPFSRARTLAVPVFGFRFPLGVCSRSAAVAWYRHWHAVFLTRALRRTLADEWADKHQIERDGTVYRAIRQLEREVIPQVDGMVFVSEWARQALLSWLPEVSTVPYAVIDNFVAPHDGQPDREPLGDLVTVGHLEPVKNHQYLLRILAEAKQAGRDVSLDIFGDGPLKRDLVGLTRSLGLEGQVRFRGFRTDLRDFLPRYKAYAHVSYSESSSLAIIEAMAAGLPILAGAIGPLAELCDDGVEARFWPLDDPAAAASILIELLDDEPRRLTAANAAKRRFRRDFDAEVIAPRLRSFLLGLHPGRAGDADSRTSLAG